jgi:hypothetical protein
MTFLTLPAPLSSQLSLYLSLACGQNVLLNAALADVEDVATYLKQKKMHVAARFGALRIGLHLYNTGALPVIPLVASSIPLVAFLPCTHGSSNAVMAVAR